MTDLAYKVAPTSKKKLRLLAERFWGNGINPPFPIVEVLDVQISRLWGDRYTFAVLEEELMGDSHGLTDPDQMVVLIRRDVYDGANRGVGRDRFTMAHELGHLLLHGGGRYLERPAPGALAMPPTHKKYEDSEWQANAFASELLMPVNIVRQCSTAAELALLAGVSVQAAEVRISILRQEGVL